MELFQRAKQLFLGVVVCAGLACVAAGAHAQVPVTVTSDLPATINQIETIAKWGEQLSSMSKQLDQMKQVYGTLQGMRNLGSLMNNDLLTQYLPQDYVGAVQALKNGGGGSFAGISGSVNDIVRANQLRSCAELNSDPAMRTTCTQQWQQLALQKQIDIPTTIRVAQGQPVQVSVARDLDFSGVPPVR